MISALFAAEGPHISLKAETLFHIGDFAITNSIIYGALVAGFIAVLSFSVAKRISLKPKAGLVQIYELLMEFIINMIEAPFADRQKAAKYAPIFGFFFLFIVISNVSGLIPIVGSGVYANTSEGQIPIFRPFTADLNGTLAMSIVAIIIVQYLAIKESGLIGHLKHYFTDKPFNPINFFIGILEVFGEITRIVSLALRLFLNTTVGEILIAVFAFVGSYGASFTLLPIIAFEVLVALIQAYVFTVLTATYLGLAIKHEHDEHDQQHNPSEKLEFKPASN